MIFIEGVSGVGKSTAVRTLAERLREAGFRVAEHYEGDADSPLDLCWVAYLTPEEYAAVLARFPAEREILKTHTRCAGSYCLVRYRVDRVPLYSEKLDRDMHSREFCFREGNDLPLSVFTEVFSGLWRRYLRNCPAELDYDIYDASLVSHMTNDLMRGYHATPEELTAHLSALLEIVGEMHPVIFYLYTDDVSKRVKSARVSRNQPPLTAEKLQFWVDRMAMDLRVLPNLRADIRYIDISRGDWTQALEAMYRSLADG